MVCLKNILFISHRINTIEELKNTDVSLGIELDIRDSPCGKIRVVHDEFKDGEDLREYLKFFNHKFIIFNIKSERLEFEIMKITNDLNISNYFFLDSSVPMINILTNKMNNSNVAIRFSEFEPIEYVLKFKNKVKWVWVDCFTNFILTYENYNILKNNGFKICIVSPELQGQQEKIEEYKNIMIENNIIPDAICCKEYNIDRWKN